MTTASEEPVEHIATRMSTLAGYSMSPLHCSETSAAFPVLYRAAVRSHLFFVCYAYAFMHTYPVRLHTQKRLPTPMLDASRKRVPNLLL